MAIVIKVVFLGESGVCKTCLIQRFISSTYNEDNQPSKSASFTSKLYHLPDMNNSVKFQIWDTAGQEIFKSLAKLYYKDANAAIVVYDITKRKSFEAVKSWISELKQNIGDSIIVAIAGNKADLLEKEEVDLGTSQNYAESISALFKQTSAKENIGIDELFMLIARNFLANKNIPINPNPNIILGKDNKDNKINHKKCC